MRFSRSNVYTLLLAAPLVLTACGKKNETTVNANVSAAQAEKVVDVTTAPAEQRNVSKYMEATGSIAADGQSDVAPTVAGRIIEVNFDVGSFVSRGDVMVRLDSRDAQIRLEQAQGQVAQQERAVQQAEANVRQAEANVNQVRERIGLGSGSNFDVYSIPEVKAAKSALDLAEKEVGRFERLLATGDVSRSAYDQRRQQRDQLRAQYEASLNSTRQAYAGIATAQAGVDTSRAALAASRTAAQTARTQIEAAQKAINDATIYAPMSGYISERTADVGEYVSPSAPNTKVATIVRTNPVRMRIEVPEQSIAQVRVGQSVSVRTSSELERSFAGTITRVLPGLNAASRTLIAEAEIENQGGLLKPGQFATVRILLPETEPVVIVPLTAIKNEVGSSRVFVIRDGRAEQRIVQTGETEGEFVQIRNGLRPDERVIASNVSQISDGTPVRQ